MSNKLDALKAAFAKPTNDNNSNQNYGDQYPFWQMEDGEQAVVRFLPDLDEENPLLFLAEKLMHTLQINGQRRSVPCAKMFGEKDCPICKLSGEHYSLAKAAKDAGDNVTAEQERIIGKKYWRNKQHIARAVIIKDPLKPDEDGKTHEGEVRTLTLSYQLYEAINAAFSSGELDEAPFEFNGGCDFLIKKKVVKDGKNEYASYVYSSFARKSTDLDPEGIEIKNLTDLLPEQVPYDKLVELLEADVTGSAVSNGNTSTNTPSSPTKTDLQGQLSALKDKTSEAKVEESVPDKVDGNIEDEADAILASIMGNR